MYLYITSRYIVLVVQVLYLYLVACYAELHHSSGDLVKAVTMASDSVRKLRVAHNSCGEKLEVSKGRNNDCDLVFDQISSTEQLVASLLLLGSLHHEMSEPLLAQDILQSALIAVEQVAVAPETSGSKLLTQTSLQALLQVTRMLSICQCAPQA